jgi:hypothetical protein
MTYTRVCDIFGGRVKYQVTGPLGTFQAEGPIAKFGEVRATAEWFSGCNRAEP